tara:strand:+ start:816 stop:1802 length:987 start_codon:yes stop_codon:yes gene_type:complete
MEDGSLKVIFSEVLRGYSLVDSSFGKSRINHFTNFDSAALDIKNKAFYDKAVKEGLPSRDERIDYLLEEGIWTNEKNKEILNTKSYIIGLKSSKSKAFIQAQVDQINRNLEENQLKLCKLELEKEEMIGFTAEAYAARRINEFYMYNAFSTDKGESLFTAEEFEELEEKKMMELISLYNATTKKFNSNKLKLVSLAGFFTNIFYMCDNDAFVFYGKAIVQLTFYQIELFGYARYYKSLLEQTEGRPPGDMMDKPEKLVEWFDSTKSAKEVLAKVDKGEGTASSLVGASKQDLKRLGLDNPQETINLAKKAAAKGGKLTMEDMMKLHGV